MVADSRAARPEGIRAVPITSSTLDSVVMVSEDTATAVHARRERGSGSRRTRAKASRANPPIPARMALRASGEACSKPSLRAT